MELDLLDSLENLQKRLKSECSIFIDHDYFGWNVGVKTERNEYPYWIRFEGATLKEAVNKLLAWFNGVPGTQLGWGPECFNNTKPEQFLPK